MRILLTNTGNLPWNSCGCLLVVRVGRDCSRAKEEQPASVCCSPKKSLWQNFVPVLVCGHRAKSWQRGIVSGLRERATKSCNALQTSGECVDSQDGCPQSEPVMYSVSCISVFMGCGRGFSLRFLIPHDPHPRAVGPAPPLRRSLLSTHEKTMPRARQRKTSSSWRATPTW